jgi:Protein of unknown function (DUF4013)
MSSLDSACKDFLKDPQWVLKTTIGSLVNALALLCFAINPALIPLTFLLCGISTGYILRSIRGSIAGQQDMPPWSDWLDLTISGLSWLSITFGFYLFAMSIFLISLLAAAALGVHHVQNANSLIWAQSTYQCLYWLVIGQNFFLAILMVNFAEEEKMAAGFAWCKAAKRILKAPFLLVTAWLAGSALVGLAVLVPSLTLVGSLTTPFFYFLAQVIAGRLMGQTWAHINSLD